MSVMSDMIEKISDFRAEAEENPNAVDYLESQHRQVEALFKQMDELGDRAHKARAELFEEIAHLLSHHAKIEETLFYPQSKDVDKDMTLESYEEHEVMKHLISRLKHTDPKDETFKAKCTVLKEVVNHHVKEEEHDLFPEMKKKYSADELKAIGYELKKKFDSLESRYAGLH